MSVSGGRDGTSRTVYTTGQMMLLTDRSLISSSYETKNLRQWFRRPYWPISEDRDRTTHEW